MILQNANLCTLFLCGTKQLIDWIAQNALDCAHNVSWNLVSFFIFKGQLPLLAFFNWIATAAVWICYNIIFHPFVDACLYILIATLIESVTINQRQFFFTRRIIFSFLLYALHIRVSHILKADATRLQAILPSKQKGSSAVTLRPLLCDQTWATRYPFSVSYCIIFCIRQQAICCISCRKPLPDHFLRCRSFEEIVSLHMAEASL